MLTATDQRWEEFAAREPYFAVLTADKYLRANLTPERLCEFFATGDDEVAWMRRIPSQRR